MAQKQTAELPRISMVGTCALLCESTGPLDIEHQQRIWALTEEVSKWETVQEVMPCLNNLMVIFDPIAIPVETLEQKLVDAWVNCEAPPIQGKRVEIPVVYGGEFGLDLREAAEYAGLSIDDFVNIHTGGEYVVYALGSHPGFAYMGGLDPQDFCAATKRATRACEGRVGRDRRLANRRHHLGHAQRMESAGQQRAFFF